MVLRTVPRTLLVLTLALGVGAPLPASARSEKAKAKAAAKAAPGKSVKAPAGAKADARSKPEPESKAEPGVKAATGAKPEAEAKPADATGDAAQQVALGIQKFYNTHSDFYARFTQVVQKKGLAKGIQREGITWLAKGDATKGEQGKMRWDYPSEDVYYFCDGITLWLYEKRQRSAAKIPVKDSQLYQATAFLSGQGNLGEHFTLALEPSPVEGTWRLKLTPKKGTQVMRSLTLTVDQKTHAVRASELIDPLGDKTTLLWRDTKYEKLDAKVFVWTPPPGVTVRNLAPDAPTAPKKLQP